MEKIVNKKLNLNLLNKDDYSSLLGFTYDLNVNSSVKQIYDKDSELNSQKYAVTNKIKDDKRFK
jgi:hypothetical protein